MSFSILPTAALWKNSENPEKDTAQQLFSDVDPAAFGANENIF